MANIGRRAACDSVHVRSCANFRKATGLVREHNKQKKKKNCKAAQMQSIQVQETIFHIHAYEREIDYPQCSAYQ